MACKALCLALCLEETLDGSRCAEEVTAALVCVCMLGQPLVSGQRVTAAPCSPQL